MGAGTGPLVRGGAADVKAAQTCEKIHLHASEVLSYTPNTASKNMVMALHAAVDT